MLLMFLIKFPITSFHDLGGKNTEQDVVPAICCQKETNGIPES